MVEFAIVLPVILAIVLGGIDLSRAYERQLRLEQATRHASETVAMQAQSASEAQSMARQIVCLQFDRPTDCGLASLTTPEACADVCLNVVFSRSATALGATTEHPMATAVVTVAAVFRTVVPYPWIASGSSEVSLSAESTYAVLQGR